MKHPNVLNSSADSSSAVTLGFFFRLHHDYMLRSLWAMLSVIGSVTPRATPPIRVSLILTADSNLLLERSLPQMFMFKTKTGNVLVLSGTHVVITSSSFFLTVTLVKITPCFISN